MDKREAIIYLKERLGEIPDLAKLKYTNSEYPLWIQTIRGIVEKVFGKESLEYQKLAEQYSISGSFADARQNSYIRILQKRATAILSIIQTWETLGLETETKRSSEPPETHTVKANWKAIEGEFGITKMRFGKRINFIKDPFTRTIIFRDVEQAFILTKQNYSKPAVILAGSVIEELLRQYLKHRGISPLSDNFNGYIKTCEQYGLLKNSVSRLSDSTRQFRNLVHLAAEKTKKHTITKATAIGAVSAIFTITNDF